MKHKILLVCNTEDVLRGKNVLTWDYYTLYLELIGLGFDVVKFEYLREHKLHGKAEMNKRLVEAVKSEKPQYVFLTFFTDEYIPDALIEISKHAKTIGYFYDDPWRMDYCTGIAKLINFVTTSDVNGVRRFKERNVHNVIYSPFGAVNHKLGDKNWCKTYDISFVGGFHPQRQYVVDMLLRAGYFVNVWGDNWGNGAVDQVEMTNIFRKSRINLNLSNCVAFDINIWRNSLFKYRAIRCCVAQYLASRRLHDVKTREMIKFRHYEINAAGGFQISYLVEGLDAMYQNQVELVTYSTIDDLVEKVKYYLAHSSERESIAKAGYEKTIQSHTMDLRLRALLCAVDNQGQ